MRGDEEGMIVEEPASEARATGEDYIDLATRFEGPINVALFWDRTKGDLVVVAQDRLTGEDVRIPVDADRAAEVYRHPFAHASEGQVVRLKGMARG